MGGSGSRVRWVASVFGKARSSRLKDYSRSSPQFAIRQYPAILMAVIAFAGLAAASIWMSSNALTESFRIAGQQFKFKVSAAQIAIHQRLLAYEQVLRGGVGLFSATDNGVTRSEWHTYIDTLAIDKNYPGIQGIGFSKRILPNALAAHIQKIRAEGFQNYRIKPTGERAEYTSIIYLEPFDWRNQRAFGYDMFTNPVRREAMIRARDEGVPSMSGKVTLVQETDKGVQNGFLMYLPVYKTATPPRTIAERRAALIGYVYAPFRMRDLMEGILGSEQLLNIRMEIFDGRSVNEAEKLYDSADSPLQSGNPVFSLDQPLANGGHSWMIRFSSLPTFDAGIDRQKARLILFGGLLGSILFGIVVWALSVNRARARQLANVNRQLVHAKDAAEAANRAKSLFLANMSHELRTPLNAVLGYAQLFRKDGKLSEWQRNALDTIQQSGEHLLTLISDILDVSKVEAGKLDLCPGPVDLPLFLDGVADIIRVRAEEKGIAFFFEPPPDLPKRMQVDEKRLRQILLNLLGNAVKFTDHGHVILQVTATQGSDDKVLLRCEVLDTGVGIASDKQAAIFKPFEQVCDAQRRSGGTGLGLSISRELLRLMQSEIQFESVLGRGSRFWFEILLPASGASPAQSVASGSVTGYVGPRLNALIVDDIAENRAVLAGMLGGVGFDVREAVHGLDGVEQARAKRPDVILMDIMMPVMDGLEATRELRHSAELASIPIIAVSASVGTDDQARSLAAGADAFLGKPVAQDLLFQEIGKLLHLRWIYDTSDQEAEVEAAALLVAPSHAELMLLYEIAKIGNMRTIRKCADDLAARDIRMRPFVNRIHQFADAYDSKALVAFIGGYFDRNREVAA